MKFFFLFLFLMCCNQPYQPPPPYSQAFQTNTDVQVQIAQPPPTRDLGPRVISCPLGVAVYGGWSWNGSTWYWRSPYCDTNHIGMSFRNSYYTDGVYHEATWIRSGVPLRSSVVQNNYYINRSPTVYGAPTIVQEPTTAPAPTGWAKAAVQTPTVAQPVKTPGWGTSMAQSRTTVEAVKPIGAGVDNKGMVPLGGTNNTSLGKISVPIQPSSGASKVSVWGSPSSSPSNTAPVKTSTWGAPSSTSKPATSSSGWGSKPAASSSPSRSTSSWGSSSSRSSSSSSSSSSSTRR